MAKTSAMRVPNGAVHPPAMMPGEWEPHDATWLAFPHNVSDWPGRFGPIPWVYGDIIKKVTAGEVVNLLVNDAAHETKAKRVLKAMGVGAAAVKFRRFPTNRIWARDFGPIFVRETARAGTDGKASDAGVAIARFRFNAWAKYPDWRRDDAIPGRASKALKLPLRSIRHNGRDVVLEGGAIDVNGAGSILTTEECLLDPKVQVRNPGFSRADYETVFREALGATTTLWLNKGIAGDDTHGHVDDLARFVDARTIVLCQENDGSDANHRPLAENRERLEGARLADGSRPEVVALPMPAPLAFAGQRVPASYANFYICNAAVLVPTF
ncbi:MAG TPA: agmatine deiminase family protein, partial [Polyangia bacterium]